MPQMLPDQNQNDPNATANTPTPDPSQQQPSTTPQTPAATAPQDQTVSNAPQTQTSALNATIPANPTTPTPALQPNQPDANHPAVQRAGVLRSIATALAGGPRYTSTIDPVNGTITKTPVPLSRGDLAMAIVSEALSGGMAGLSVKPGPGNVGRAAGAGFAQVQSEMQQADQNQQAQDQRDLKNQTTSLAQKGAALEQNSRTMLNTAQAERMGVNSLKDAVQQNASLLQSYDEVGAVQETNVSQDALMEGLKSGKYKGTDQIAVPDGFTTINGKYEQTFAIVANPSAKVHLTQEMWDQFADNNVAGYARGVKIPAGGSMVPGTMVASANHQLQANQLMQADVATVVDGLKNSKDKATQELAAGIPDFKKLLSDPQTGPTLNNALAKFQKYVSHSDLHGMDFFQSLQQMAQPSKPNPANPQQSIPNGDAPLANTIAGAFGNGDPTKGWAILKAYSNEVTPTKITSVPQAEGILADHTSSPQAKLDAKSYLATDQKRVDSEAAAKKGVSGKGGSLGVASLTPQEYKSIIDGIGKYDLDASQLLRYGKADQLKILADVKVAYPNYDATKYAAKLGLQKWAESGKGGDQIQSLNTLHGHTQDFVENMNALGNLNTSLLNTPINKLKLMTGNPQIVSLVGRMLAPRTEYMNLLNNNHALTVDDKENAKALLNENMSPAQMLAAMQQINGTADIRGANTNARYKAVLGQDMPNYHAPAGSGSGSAPTPPVAGAIAGRNAAGQIVAWKLPNGTVQKVGQ